MKKKKEGRKCETCKHWERTILSGSFVPTDLKNSFGNCLRNKSYDQLRNEDYHSTEEEKLKVFSASEMYAISEDYYYPNILTGKDFFCKNYQKK